MLKGIYDIFTIEFSIHGLESCIIISVSILIVTILLKKGLSISRNEPINQSNNIKSTQNSIESKESSYKPESYFEISQQQGKKLQSIIDILIRIKAPCSYKVCNRILSCQIDYLRKTNLCKSDLFDFIIKKANERIETAKRTFVKDECETVIQIIRLLQNGSTIEEVVNSISSTEKMIIEQEIEAVANRDLNVIVNNQEINKYGYILNKKSVNISQIVAGLLSNAIHREKERLIEEKNPTPSTALNTHPTETTQGQIQSSAHIISKIIYGLYINALLKERIELIEKNKIISTDILESKTALHESYQHNENTKNTEIHLQSYDKSNSQSCRWVSSNEEIEVQGIKLTRGNFYIGEYLLLPDYILRSNQYIRGEQKEKYIYGPVLNPRLKASDKEIFQNYFTSYHNMSPYWRYEYLLWLSEKKEAYEAPTDILLYYLYGCEIRMFIDPKTKEDERRMILLEIINIYRSLKSKLRNNEDWQLTFKLTDFIELSIIKYFSQNKNEFKIQDIVNNSRKYQDYYFAHKIAKENILSINNAFYIACEIYDIEQFIPSKYISFAKEYFTEEFIRFFHNYNIELEISKTENKAITYYNNESHFNPEKINLFYKIDSLPYSSWMINDGIRNCVHHLISKFRLYNRAKERSDGNETIAAIQLLPNKIDVKEIPKIQNLIAHIENEMGEDNYLIKPIDWILALWEYERKDEKHIHKEYVDSIIKGLRRIGFDIVPDYEIDKKRFDFGDICVIYKNEKHLPIQDTTEYGKSELLIKLASHIVLTDNVSCSDLTFIEQQLLSYNNKSGDFLHLRASIRWRFYSKKTPIDKYDRNIIAGLTEVERNSMSDTLLKLTCINGDIHPKRIDSLKKILPILGVEAENIHSQIHRLLTKDNGFAVIEEKSDAIEFTINRESTSEKEKAKQSVVINPQKLRIFEEQTKAAQEMLSNIFVEEETTAQNMESDNTSSAWIGILKLLFTKEIWERTEIEEICKNQGLILGAVLEEINDYSYEKVDDILIEDDGEKIYISLNYKEQLI